MAKKAPPRAPKKRILPNHPLEGLYQCLTDRLQYRVTWDPRLGTQGELVQQRIKNGIDGEPYIVNPEQINHLITWNSFRFISPNPPKTAQ